MEQREFEMAVGIMFILSCSDFIESEVF
jgi:hypothetical protein